GPRVTGRTTAAVISLMTATGARRSDSTAGSITATATLVWVTGAPNGPAARFATTRRWRAEMPAGLRTLTSNQTYLPQRPTPPRAQSARKTTRRDQPRHVLRMRQQNRRGSRGPHQLQLMLAARRR